MPGSHLQRKQKQKRMKPSIIVRTDQENGDGSTNRGLTIAKMERRERFIPSLASSASVVVALILKKVDL